MHMEVFETPNSFLALNRGGKREKKKGLIILYFIPGMVLFYFTFFDLQQNAAGPLSNSACGVY